MSPRRKIEPDSRDLFRLPDRRPRRWVLPVVTTVAALVILAALSASTFVLVKYKLHHREVVQNAAVLTTVQSFMTLYTSPDPFHANDYADKVLKGGTGQFAKLYQEKMNEIVFQVARAEPTKGSVQDLGIERWNDDGSVDVVVAAKTSTKLPNGKVVEDGNRWVVTATKEGEQWKISNLLQVI